jgi:hypothetical protein
VRLHASASGQSRLKRAIPGYGQGMWRRCVLVLLAIVAGAGCSGGHASSPAKSPSGIAGSIASPAVGPAATGICSATITRRALPAWARSGFQPPTVAMPYVMGARGSIVAILWADRDPLHAPPLANRANKVLWVSRLGVRPGAPLRIRATLNGTGRAATVDLAQGPGPSYVDLPAAGCWSLDLSWSGHHDQLALRYTAS